ncbi:hypothetical protein C0993_011243 [Termitomyces sp. T159_Od127]|nr:hypothetical protein C0993_011243 [Termitomyces sp. T159_Od127]
MKPTGDYTVHFADPDIFFQWDDILQVIVPRSSVMASAPSSAAQADCVQDNAHCPICLSTPVAPRMSKCGHIFCFPCILHYLGTSDNKWVRCPICFDSINEKQLKAVKWYDGPPHLEDGVVPPPASSSSFVSDEVFDTVPRTGSTMHMRLVQRPQITTLALPRSRTWPSDLLPPHQAPFHFLPDVFNFAKFMLATPAYLISDLSKDLDDLATERRILIGMNDSLGLSFVDGADQKIRDKIVEAIALDTPSLKKQIDKATRDQRAIEERHALNERRKLEEAARLDSSDVPSEFLALKSSTPTRTSTPLSPNMEVSQTSHATYRNGPRQRRNVNPPPPSTSTYYYYQAASGLPLFLHPLEVKILLSHYKSYSSFPDTISVRVESSAEGTVDDDLRKRYKYLAHMPEGADVVFIEADLFNVVGADGLKNFEGALKTRTARRKEKERKDDRARIRAEKGQSNSYPAWSYASPSHAYSIPVSVPTVEDIEENPQENVPAVPLPQVSGAWGARSFASALHSSSANGNRGQAPSQPHEVDEWDLDAAWHELERTAGGRKKRGQRLVVLGSGGRRR